MQLLGGSRPDRRHELLLRASLLTGQDAISAWNEWNATTDLNFVDAGSRRLLPLLYRNLKTHGVNDPIMRTLKGVYRRTWYENQLLFHRMAVVVRKLEDAGIETLLLKGAALVSLYYKDPGLRPMGDLDLLVPTSKAADAIEVLTRASCTPLGKRNVPIARLIQSEVFKQTIHAEHFAESGGREFDLHWHVLLDFLKPDDDADFWERSVPAVLHDVRTRALEPADQLLHVCFHGLGWNTVLPVRWIADAMIVLRSSPDLDWERLVFQTKKRRVVLEMRSALNYLSETLDAEVPAWVLQALNDAAVSRRERMWYKAKMSPPHVATDSVVLIRTYLRSASRADLGHPVVGFPRFLRHAWGLDHVWRVPGYVTSAVLARARRRLRAAVGY